MSELNLIKVAKEILAIKEDFKFHVKSNNTSESDFELYDFEQTFNAFDFGLSIDEEVEVTMRIYVFIPLDRKKEDCLVYFAGVFAYSVPYSKVFIDDINKQHIEPKLKKEKYLLNIGTPKKISKSRTIKKNT